MHAAKRMQATKKIRPADQMSEALITSVFLAISGGLQDAYTYNIRDGVFSNAQTGNIVLMSQSFMTGNWIGTVRYLIPLLFFAAGIFLAELAGSRFRHAERLHWRQGILLAEILLLFLAGWIPENCNMIATALVSAACAMQIQSFRKVEGYAYASTMCIGNLRSAVAAFSCYLRERKEEQRREVLYYTMVIVSFGLGAGIGGLLSGWYGRHAVWFSCLFLAAGVLLMFRKKTKRI